MKVKGLFPPLFLLVTLLVTLELMVQRDLIPSYLMPAPTQIYQAFIEQAQELFLAAGATLRATAYGFFISVMVAQTLAIVLSLFPFLFQSIYPFAVAFQTVPLIALAPMIVIWFGFGEPTVRASAAIVSFFPILSNALSGLQSTKKEDLELFQFLGASRLQTLLRLKLPCSLMATFSGLRVAAGLSVVGALVGEFVGGGGLGSLIDTARTQQRIDLVFACLFLSSVLGLMFVGFVSLTEKIFLSWRPFRDQVNPST